MVALLKHAALAWNPVFETRRRLQEGNLSFGTVMLPFFAVVVGCNLASSAAQAFYIESLAYAAGVEAPNHPLLGSFAQECLSVIGILLPLGVVALFPKRAFAPAGRRATLAAILVIAAAWSFYGAAIGIPINFIAGMLTVKNVTLGAMIYFLLSVAGSLLIFGLLIWFWFRVLRGVLELSRWAFALITASTLGAMGLLVAFVRWAV